MPIDVLAFGAHADDIEIGAGGTLLKHAKAGQSIVLCDLTKAELSSNGDASTRLQEAETAKCRMKAMERIQLDLGDRNLLLSDASIRAVVGVIRKHKPRIILAPYWEDRHPDHEHCSRIIREAVFSAGIRKYAPEAGEAHKVLSVYYYFINDFVEPDICVDVTGVYDGKMDILQSYESQFQPADGRVETPLNTGYFEQIRSREYGFGRKIGTQYAEGFKVRGPLANDYLG